MFLGEMLTQNSFSKATDRMSNSFKSCEYRNDRVFIPNVRCAGLAIYGPSCVRGAAAAVVVL